MRNAEQDEILRALRNTVRTLETMTRELSHLLAPGQGKSISPQEARRILTVAAHTLAQVGQRMDSELSMPPPDQS
jgi:hypothetical protein